LPGCNGVHGSTTLKEVWDQEKSEKGEEEVHAEQLVELAELRSMGWMLSSELGI
jgi:hypothetical protein